jgi:hypothetical protein
MADDVSPPYSVVRELLLSLEEYDWKIYILLRLFERMNHVRHGNSHQVGTYVVPLMEELIWSATAGRVNLKRTCSYEKAEIYYSTGITWRDKTDNAFSLHSSHQPSEKLCVLLGIKNAVFFFSWAAVIVTIKTIDYTDVISPCPQVAWIVFKKPQFDF